MSTACLRFAEVLNKVRAIQTPPFRPQIPEGDSTKNHLDVVTLMKDCWTEKPELRPTFDDVKKRLRQINKGK